MKMRTRRVAVPLEPLFGTMAVPIGFQSIYIGAFGYLFTLYTFKRRYFQREEGQDLFSMYPVDNSLTIGFS